MMNDKNGKMEELKDQKKNRPLKKSLLMRLSSARNSGVIKAFSMMLAVIIVFRYNLQPDSARYYG